MADKDIVERILRVRDIDEQKAEVGLSATTSAHKC